MKSNLELALEAGVISCGHSTDPEGIVAIDSLVALVEARLIAKLLELYGDEFQYYTPNQIAAAVLRERERVLSCYSPDDTANDWADKIRGTK